MRFIFDLFNFRSLFKVHVKDIGGLLLLDFSIVMHFLELYLLLLKSD
jgi:hypothetical protein